jgi:hypothetical protein
MTQCGTVRGNSARIGTGDRTGWTIEHAATDDVGSLWRAIPHEMFWSAPGVLLLQLTT